MASDVADATGGTLVGPDVPVTHVRPLSAIDVGALAFAGARAARPSGPAGAVVIVARGTGSVGESTRVEVENPRLAYALAISALFVPPPRLGIASSARVANGARLGADVTIGEGVTIEDGTEIGDRTRIEHGAVVMSGTSIGDDCWIGARAVIGSSGFGYERDSRGVPVHVPHLGGVRIGRDVHIGANSVVARGTIGDTVIADHTKISAVVNVQHNARIGVSCIVAGHAQISGSVVIGDRCWIGPNSTIRQSVRIGDEATVGLGCLVLEDVPARTSLMGYAAMPVVATIGRSAAAPAGDDFTTAFDNLVRDTLRLGVDVPIDDTLGPLDVPEWDSLANVNLLLGLQRAFGFDFDPDAFVELKSIGDIRREVRRLATVGVAR